MFTLFFLQTKQNKNVSYLSDSMVYLPSDKEKKNKTDESICDVRLSPEHSGWRVFLTRRSDHSPKLQETKAPTSWNSLAKTTVS